MGVTQQVQGLGLFFDPKSKLNPAVQLEKAQKEGLETLDEGPLEEDAWEVFLDCVQEQEPEQEQE